MVEVVVLSSEGLDEDQEDAAAIGTDVRGELGSSAVHSPMAW